MGFLQLSSTRRKVSKETLSRERASKILLQHAKQDNSKVLAQLATTVKATGLAQVVAQVEKMIADIKKESDDEVHHRDFCIEEFHKSDLDIKESDYLVEDLTTKVNDLTAM